MNPEQRKKIITVGVLGVLLVGVIIYQVVHLSGGAVGTQAKKAATQASAAAAKSGTKPAPAAAKSGAGAEENVAFKMSDVDLKKLNERVEILDFDYAARKIPRDPMKPLVEPPKDIRSAKNVKKPGAPKAPVLPPGPGGFQDEMIKTAILEKVVSGIVWDSANPCAVVDDQILFVGSQLPVFVGSQFPLDLTVVAIGPDSVTFRGGNVELPVRLKE